MKAVILARVSTEMQEDGFSLDAQLDRLRNYCSFKGLEIAKEFTFVESSFHGKRTKFYEAVNYIKRQSKLTALVVDILYLLGIIISGGILISFFTSGNYDTGKKSVSNTLSIQAANKNTLNAFNYLTVQPDFVFKGMNSLNSVSKYYDLMCSDESYDFYCIYSAYGKIGNSQKTKEKYLGKIIKTPFLVWSYANDKDTVYLSDRGYISEYQSIRDSSSCHLVDEKNINKYVSETDNKRGDIEVIGILKNISAIDGRLILDPCFYIKKHNSNSSSSSKSSYNTPQISSNLTLDISKPVYEKNENIALLAQWIGPDVDCKILEEKVKETLVSRHFEIVENSLSCAGNDNKSLIQLRVQFKSPRITALVASLFPKMFLTASKGL